MDGLVVEWLPATESARVRFPAHAYIFASFDEGIHPSKPFCKHALHCQIPQMVRLWGPGFDSRRLHHVGEVAEWSKALRSGRSLFGGVGSNPTLTIF